jgi:PAS domain S-box-containing protein
LGKQKDGIWIIDLEAQTVYANQRMAEILGTSTSEMIGRPSFTYVFPEDAQAAQQLFTAKKHGDSSPFHFKLRRQDGSAIWVDVQGTPLYNAAQEFYGIVGTFSVADAATTGPQSDSAKAEPGQGSFDTRKR